MKSRNGSGTEGEQGSGCPKMCCPKGAWEQKLWYEWVIGAVPDARVSGRGASAGGI